MHYCIWCDEEIIIDMSWQRLLNLRNRTYLCEECGGKLERITGDRCQRCSRQSANNICYDCIRWQQLFDMDDPLVWNYSLYNYNEFMKEVVVRWKYRGDYYISEMFRNSFAHQFKEIFSKQLNNLIIVPIPLSPERLFERGFNQAYVLADFIKHTVQEILTRIHSEKQSKRTRFERLTSKNPFNLKISINKPVVLVDDIYTTGRTIRHAATLLKASGCPKIYSFTLIRG